MSEDKKDSFLDWAKNLCLSPDPDIDGYTIETFQKHDDEPPIIVLTNKETGGTLTGNFCWGSDYWCESENDYDPEAPDFGVYSYIDIKGMHAGGRMGDFEEAYDHLKMLMEWEEEALCS